MMWRSGGGRTELCLSQREGRCRKPFLVQEAPFSVPVVSWTVAYHTGEAPWRRDSSPCCLYPSFTLNFHGNDFTCLLGFSKESAFIALLNGRKCSEGYSSGRCEPPEGQSVPEPREGCTDPPTCSHCSSAAEGKLEGTKIQKGHKFLWNKWECKFPMDPSWCCGVTTVKADLA